MFVTPVGPYELLRFVNGLKHNKSPGFDNIGPGLVKLVFPAICCPLLHIYNLSLSTGAVPEKFKIARVIPVLRRVMYSWHAIIDLFHCSVYLIDYWRKSWQQD